MSNHQKNKTLSLIIPVYLQQNFIQENLNSLIKVLTNIRFNYELIIICDGLDDNSFQIIKRMTLHKTIVLAYQKNRGKAFAIRLGMKYAHGDYVMYIDSGLDIDPNGISMLIEHLIWYDADIIVGSKRHLASLVNYTLERKIFSFAYYLFVKILFGLKITDTQAGIKIFKSDVITKILPRLNQEKFAGDLEMLLIARSLGFKKIYEAPIKLNYHFSKLTTSATFQEIVRILKDTVILFFRLRFTHYYQEPIMRLITPKDLSVITRL